MRRARRKDEIFLAPLFQVVQRGFLLRGARVEAGFPAYSLESAVWSPAGRFVRLYPIQDGNSSCSASHHITLNLFAGRASG